jgi:hypothetical protein
MFCTHILHAKVVYHEGELDWASDISPDPRRKFCLMIAMDGKATRKELVGKDSLLGQVIHAFMNLNVGVATRDQGE